MTTIDQDAEETVLQSSHRERAEDQERRQQDRDERFVEQFLAGKLRQKGWLTCGSLEPSPTPHG